MGSDIDNPIQSYILTLNQNSNKISKCGELLDANLVTLTTELTSFYGLKSIFRVEKIKILQADRHVFHWRQMPIETLPLDFSDLSLNSFYAILYHFTLLSVNIIVHVKGLFTISILFLYQIIYSFLGNKPIKCIAVVQIFQLLIRVTAFDYLKSGFWYLNFLPNRWIKKENIFCLLVSILNLKSKWFGTHLDCIRKYFAN